MKTKEILIAFFSVAMLCFIVVQYGCKKENNTSPTASFTVLPSSGTTETQFQFDATGCSDEENETSVLQVRWDWENDGNWDTDWSSNKTVIHQYNIAGNYTVALEVKDTEGLTDSETHNVTVQEGSSNTAPLAVFSINPISGTTSTTFQFDASGSYDNEDPTSDLQVRWDFDGNGSWDTGWDYDKTEDHQYSAEGTYTAKMEVKDTEGLTDYTTQTVTVDNGGGGNGCDGQTSLTYGGQTYYIVEIGDQCWMAENLNYETGSSWCYDNDPSNCATYGRLYDWSTALGVCPSGWHLPSDDEWKILEGNADTQYGVGDPEWDDTGYRGYDAGKRLKSTTGWNQNTGTDFFGFIALPSGRRTTGGSFFNLGYHGSWWSSTEGSGTSAWRRNLNYDSGQVYRYNSNKVDGFSVRCLKD